MVPPKGLIGDRALTRHISPIGLSQTFSAEFRHFPAQMPASGRNVISDSPTRSRGHGQAAQRGDRSVDGVKNATRAPMAWYVSYRTAGKTVMHILKSRELAIDAACRFLDRGYRDALEVGPMLGPRDSSGQPRSSSLILAHCELVRLRHRSTGHVNAGGQSHPPRHTGEACPWQGTGGPVPMAEIDPGPPLGRRRRCHIPPTGT